ncbi:hypothetical protein B566_EDAN002112 [Ephemera danica]|nr:hypothetical protein B566_EDAN002112 [Ephemera danica]
MAQQGFSSVLKLTDLDDFITPSQECIKPVVFEKIKGAAKTKIKVDADDGDAKVNERPSKLQKVEITLSDCLACSGCVTTAESVLVSQQSGTELLRVLNNNVALPESQRQLVLVSLASTAVLSLASKYQLEAQDAACRISGYLKSLGADLVCDLSTMEDMCLLECQREFVSRHAQSSVPVLASACPGWVCYAEKTHGTWLLPYLSSVVSPQQLAGSLARKADVANGRSTYHVTLMSCYDRKLEASRPDFTDTETGQKDIDCVITAVELQQMLEMENRSLIDYEPEPLDPVPYLISSLENGTIQVSSPRGSGSGGYAENIFLYASQKLFGITPEQLQYQSIRNEDFQELVLERDGNVLLRFAVASGFRNIQNLVQKLKRKKLQYDYVEVMACPGGCLNGGAQCRPGEGGTQSRDLLEQLQTRYQQELPTRDLQEPPQAVLDQMESSLLHTQFHAVKNTISALNIKW